MVDGMVLVTEVTEDFLQSTLARFMCTVYCPTGLQISSIPDLRWHVFCKYMVESENLPPTMGALKQHILRMHVQARAWGQTAHPKQVPSDPLQNGYHKDHGDGQLNLTIIDVPPAPKAIIDMVRCQCKGNCTSNRCSCKSNNLPCTDLSVCITYCENDDDTNYENRDSDNDCDD